MPLTAEKTAARQAAYAARKAVFGTGLEVAACQHLLQLLARLPDISVISAYMPIRTEISPLPVMAELVAQGKIVAVPVIEAQGQPLRFRQWHPDAKMVAGAYGAAIPAEGAYLEPELLVAPLLSFDRAGFRLGYGGGFYDRTLEMLRARRRTLAVGFAFGAQQVAQVPIETTDQPLDAVVTEAGPILFGEALALAQPKA